MAKLSVYNAQGTVAGELELNAAHFDVKPNPSLVHEAVVAQEANARHSIAHTKDRGEVRGGGKKPWRQKGTGRARHGSTRSPIWVGGGVTFGPRNERNYSVKINRKARKKALFMVLSDKLAHGNLLGVEPCLATKTKDLVACIAKLPAKKTVLYVIPSSRPELVRAARNLDNVFVATANSLNVVDALRYGTIVFEKDAIPAFETLHAEKNASSK
ncbi:MAG: 50S ribosomal protein L4 [Patescibacteria group bacterium]